jgi:hypothetical protein
MTAEELIPRNDAATEAKVQTYQQKVRSLLFTTISTQPDITFATSRLARFLTNPSQKHHNTTDHVLLYLEGTKHLTLYFKDTEELVIASDTSFANNTLDQKSSQAFAIQLFGGLIRWRANKQDTVTTSTTEAELLALTQAAKETLFVSRLLTKLSVDLDDKKIKIK